MRKLMIIVAATSMLVACGDKKKDKAGKAGASKGGPSGAAAKAATSEARVMLSKLLSGARAYYMDSSSGGGLTPTPPQFPSPSQGPTPPLGTCCKSADKKCKPDAKVWSNPVWTSLQFSVDDPHRYSYAYKVEGKKFTVSAHGDLDCDGEYSTFEMSGDGEGKIKPALKVTKELE